MTIYLLEEFGVDRKTGDPIKVLKIGQTGRNFWKRYREYCTHTAYVRFIAKLGNMGKDMEDRFHKLFEDFRYWGFDDEKQEWVLKEEFFYYNDDIVNLFDIMKNAKSNQDRMNIFTKSEFLVKVCFNIFNLDKIKEDDIIQSYVDYKLYNLRRTINDCIDLELSWFKVMKNFYKKVNKIVHQIK